MGRAAALTTAACGALALGLAGAGAAHALAGFPDAEFGRRGLAQAPFGSGARAAAVALGPGGALTVAGDLRASGGERTLVARFTAGGALDTSFGGSGSRLDRFGAQAPSPQRGGALAVAPDGSTIVGGVAGNAIMVARYLADGALDGLFGAGGVVLRDLSRGGGMPADGGLAALALTPSGQILVAGSVGVPGDDPYEDGEPGEQIVVGRLSDRGVPDPSFGDGGFTVLLLGARSARRPARSKANALVALPDGSVVIAGRASAPNGSQRGVVARLSASGRIMRGFGRGGRVLVQAGFGSAARPARSAFHALLLKNDGSLWAAGRGSDVLGNDQAVIVRLLVDGELSVTFGRGGIVRAHFDVGPKRIAPRSIVRALAQTAEGTVFATGSDAVGGAYTVRMAPGGGLDCSYASRGYGGVVGGPPGAPGDPALDGGFGALTQPDGKLVVAGRAAGGGLLLGRIAGGPPGPRPPAASRPTLLTLRARYIGRGRGYAYGLVDARCGSARVRFVASAGKGGGRPIATRLQRVYGAYGRQVVCAPLRGLKPGRTYRVRIDSTATRGPVGGERVLRAVASGRAGLAQEGCG